LDSRQPYTPNFRLPLTVERDVAVGRPVLRATLYLQVKPPICVCRAVPVNKWRGRKLVLVALVVIPVQLRARSCGAVRSWGS
jgi:hypothetical protein